MGLLEDANDLINRGVASAGRGTKAITLKAQISELDKRGIELYAQLGRAGFEVLKGDDAFSGSQSALFSAIADHERQRAALAAELEQVRALGETAVTPAVSTMGVSSGPTGSTAVACEASGSAVRGATVACPQCNGANKRTAAFCIHCGTRLPDDLGDSAEPVPTCARCGAELRSGASFCVACGAAIENSPAKEAETPSDAGCMASVVPAEIATESFSPCAELECGQCGFSNKPDASFCRKCGAPLK